MTCVVCIYADTIVWLFVCADVGPREPKVELLRASAHQELGRPPQGGSRAGERCRHEYVEVRLVDAEREARRRCFDDPGVGPSHAPSVDAGEYFEDIHCCLEAVLQGMLEGMWSYIQDEGISEQCVGVLLTWRGVVRCAVAEGVAMIRRLPLGPEGPVVGGGPPPKGGAGGGSLEAP
jgi:hypothetical protein